MFLHNSDEASVEDMTLSYRYYFNTEETENIYF